MVSQSARRRVSTISGHFGVGLLAEDVTAHSTNLLPLNCCSNLSTPFQRLDNRLHYGRQASASQGPFMRQAVAPSEQSEQNCSSNLSTPFRRFDNRLLYGRQGSASQGYFMRQAITPLEQGEAAQPDVSCKNNITKQKPTVGPTPPLFSRLGGTEPQFARPKAELHSSSAGVIKSNTQLGTSPASECPEFARRVEHASKMKKFNSVNPTVSSQINGIEWSPRINVVESKCNYVITVELPGVDLRDIRVEMDHQNLIVRGKRMAKWQNEGGCSNDSFVTYHKREISQGQYRVVWPLPACANKDSVFAEFMEGLLQITISKL
ncbi:hypothetical protein vseg_018332 [Gypsophila vaccaria]